MTNNKNIFDFSDSSSDPIEQVIEALRAVRQYQQDWLEMGCDRVHKYFDLKDDSQEFYEDDEPLSSEDQGLIEQSWQRMKSLINEEN